MVNKDYHKINKQSMTAVKDAIIDIGCKLQVDNCENNWFRVLFSICQYLSLLFIIIML